MSWIYFFANILLPFFHLQFVKAELKKRKKEFGWNFDTFSIMYVGCLSGIVVSTTLLLGEAAGLDLRVGQAGFMFAIFSSFLLYELYIQKSLD